MPSPRRRLLRRRLSTAPHEVDRDGNPLEVEAVAELVLDPVTVVARDQAGIVDEEAEARRARANLRAVEQVQAAAVARGRLARLAQLGEEAVQLAGADAARVLLEELLDLVEQARDAATALRRGGDDGRPLAEPCLDPGTHVLELRLRHVPFRQDDDRRALRLTGHVGHGEILIDQALARIDEHERDVRPLGGREGAQLGVVLDPLALPALAAEAGGVDEHEVTVSAVEESVDCVTRGSGLLGDDYALLAEERVQEARLPDVRAAEDGDTDR